MHTKQYKKNHLKLKGPDEAMNVFNIHYFI